VIDFFILIFIFFISCCFVYICMGCCFIFLFFFLVSTQKLKDHGRAGVPLVLIYPPEEGAAPELLPELLTPRIVLEALERAAGGLAAKP
jgi:hypothetical protein